MTRRKECSNLSNAKSLKQWKQLQSMREITSNWSNRRSLTHKASRSVHVCTQHTIVREIAQKKSPQNHHENLDSLWERSRSRLPKCRPSSDFVARLELPDSTLHLTGPYGSHALPLASAWWRFGCLVPVGAFFSSSSYLCGFCHRWSHCLSSKEPGSLSLSDIRCLWRSRCGLQRCCCLHSSSARFFSTRFVSETCRRFVAARGGVSGLLFFSLKVLLPAPLLFASICALRCRGRFFTRVLLSVSSSICPGFFLWFEVWVDDGSGSCLWGIENVCLGRRGLGGSVW